MGGSKEFSTSGRLRSQRIHPMTTLTNRIRYLRDCYRADGRLGGVLDLFSRKIEHRVFFETPEALLQVPGTPLTVDRATFLPMAQAAALYRRERRLLLAAFPLVAALEPAFDAPAFDTDQPAATTRKALLCAPLLLFSATLEDDPEFPPEVLVLRLETGEEPLSFAALAALVGDENSALELAETLEGMALEPPLGPAAVRELARRLRARVPNLDLTGLEAFPRLLGEAPLRSARRAARSRPGSCCLAACALVLVENPTESRGVLHELGAIADADRHPEPLRRVLGELPAPIVPLTTGEPGAWWHSEVPAVLSRAQQRIVQAAQRAPLTLVIGPPGTGKSFTLATVVLDHLSRGEPVLVAARTDRALEVLEGKLGEILGSTSAILRGGRRAYLRELKDYLEHLLHGGHRAAAEGVRAPREIHRELVATRAVLVRFEAALARRARLERRWGGLEAARSGGGLWATTSSRFLGWFLDAWLHRGPAFWHLLEDYEEQLETRRRLTAELLRSRVHQRIEATLARHRGELQGFLQALRARHSARQDELFETIDLAVLLATFPIWMASFADLHRVVPLRRGLFRLVVIDEATQCDPASWLPAGFRAERMVITGDPKQLRHASFLGQGRRQALAERWGLDLTEGRALDYREKSLLDLASAAVAGEDEVIFLDEHYRSTPHLIGFSNREIYRGALRVMTRRPETETQRSLHVRRVDGRRESAGHNPREAAALVAELTTWIERERDLPAAVCRSLGVLSPFREQAEHLGEQLRGALGLAAIEKHRLLVGTPYAFQGEERDAMFLSFALDAESPRGAFRYLERPDVFNVAITRARALQLLFCSFQPTAAVPGGLLASYLAYALEEPGGESAAEALAGRDDGDLFLAEVRAALEQRGARTWSAWMVAGFAVDLMVEKGGATLAIDLVGAPGAWVDAFDLERCRMLRRAGLRVLPLALSAWRRNSEECLAAVFASLERPSG